MNRVLLVNDSRFESIVLNDMLSQMGYNVVITDEYHALNQIKTFKPDIVLANYIMQEIKGDRLISLIKMKNDSTRCFLTSSNQLSISDLDHADVDAIIKTPTDRATLEGILKQPPRRISDDKNNIEEDSGINEIKSKLLGWNRRRYKQWILHPSNRRSSNRRSNNRRSRDSRG